MKDEARAGEVATVDIHRIMQMLPHRFPMLMVDRVVDVVRDVSAVGIKNVTANEPFFQGHFPEYPVMPGVLIVEALAQVGAVAILMVEEFKGRIAFFAGLDNVRWKRQVKPGDTLRLEVEVGQIRRSIGTGTGTATVDGELACRGEFMFAVGPAQSSNS